MRSINNRSEYTVVVPQFHLLQRSTRCSCTVKAVVSIVTILHLHSYRCNHRWRYSCILYCSIVTTAQFQMQLQLQMQLYSGCSCTVTDTVLKLHSIDTVLQHSSYCAQFQMQLQLKMQLYSYRYSFKVEQFQLQFHIYYCSCSFKGAITVADTVVQLQLHSYRNICTVTFAQIQMHFQS